MGDTNDVCKFTIGDSYTAEQLGPAIIGQSLYDAVTAVEAEVGATYVVVAIEVEKQIVTVEKL